MDCFHDYCLACDKQCNDSTYCSQSCRLADLEKGNRSASSSPSSHVATQWSASLISRMTAEAAQKTPRSQSEAQTQTKLTPSSSRTSLTSTSSLASNGLTQQARLELQEYFSSFDQTRAAKRRSSVR